MKGIEKREGPQELRLDLPAAHSAGRMARQMLRQFALREGVPEDEVDVLVFVAGELLDNAVDHGGNAAREMDEVKDGARMNLFFTLSEGIWRLRVSDTGGGDPADLQMVVANNDELPDLMDERGRGFFLIGNMVDEILVEKSEDGLGLVFVTKRRYIRES